MQNEVPDSILEKIQKLMALRDRPSCQEEADNATARINALLVKYNISMMEVENHKPGTGVEVLLGSFDDWQTPYDGDFAKNLLNSICYFNFCKLISQPNRDPRSHGNFSLIGKKHNIEISQYMFEYCINNIKIFFEDYWKNIVFKEKKNMHKRGFYQGAITALTVRLIRQKEEAEQEHGETTMNALVKYNDAAVEAKVNEMFPKLTKSHSKPTRNHEAMAHGYLAGENLNLSKGLGSDEKQKQLK